MRTLLIFTLFFCVCLTSLLAGLNTMAEDFSKLNRGHALSRGELSEFYRSAPAGQR